MDSYYWQEGYESYMEEQLALQMDRDMYDYYMDMMYERGDKDV